ncbi:MAG: cytochrome c3 family protein [Deltaproteobacteria bacterium]|nr:cytochrome c3 family protein [Deltaproteobacteria bacterium]
MLLGIFLNFWWNLGNSVGYAPVQPIPFSHKIHAGDNKIPCLYCHVNVDKGRHATVPSMNVCMNCHLMVRSNPDPSSKDYSPYIQDLIQHYREDKPIEWIKVHDQPDFVFFNHRPHIAKGFDCAACHGDVKQMSRIEQAKPLNMGFCVDCHRQNGGPVNCNTCHH